MKKLISILLVFSMIFALSGVSFASYSYVAEVGDKAYNSIDAAFLDAGEGETVRILKNALSPSSIFGKENVALDLNGKRIGNLIIEDSTITIKNGAESATSYVTGFDDPALTISGSEVMIENGTFITDGDFVLSATDSNVTIVKGSFRGAFDADLASDIMIYSGLFSTVDIAQYVNPKCFIKENADEKTSAEYPIVVSAEEDDEGRNDVTELPLIGYVFSDDDFVCPACEVFENIYAGHYGTLISNISVVNLIFTTVHRMIHTMFKVTDFFTGASEKPDIVIPDITIPEP